MQLIKDNIDLSMYMMESETEHAVNPASSWLSEVKQHFFAPQESPKTRLPWLKTHRDFEFRPAEVTIWGGINGHGKSMIVGHVVLGLMKQGERVCMASLEMKPVRTMARICRQAYGHDELSAHYLDDFSVWTDGKLWLYDHVGSCKPALILAVIRYAVDKYKITHFVVDNLMKVIAGEDDYNAQKDFINSLCVIAGDTGVHIHIVMHVKKGRTEGDLPGKFDIKGGGANVDLVDNAFIVWRNKPKEALAMTGDLSKSDEADATLVLVKQRNGESEGMYGFWFDRPSMQYIEDKHDQAKTLDVSRKIYSNEVEF